MSIPHCSCFLARVKKLAAALFVMGLVVGVALMISRSAKPSVPAPAASAETIEATPSSEIKPLLERWGQGLPRAGQWRHGFAVVDFDGDGQLDIVHGPARKSATRVPQIFAGDGHGNFTLLARYRFPDVAFEYGDVAVADFDGDGALDLALASHLQGIAVLLRRGDAFETTGYDLGLIHDSSKEAKRVPPTNPVMKGFSSRAIEALDWNLDGRMDLIAECDGPRPFAAIQGTPQPQPCLAVLLGKPDGFEPLFPATYVPGHGDSLVITELDPAPGLEILAAANVVGSKNLMYRNTDAGLVLGELPGAPEQRVVRVVAALPPANGVARIVLGGVASGEHGLEGSLDLVNIPAGAGAASSIRVYRGEPQRAVTAIGAGDVEGDGKPEVIFGDEQGLLRVLTSENGSLVQTGQVDPPSALAGCAVYGIVFSNLDGEAGDEIIVSYAGDDGACTAAGAIEIYRRAAK